MSGVAATVVRRCATGEGRMERDDIFETVREVEHRVMAHIRERADEQRRAVDRYEVELSQLETRVNAVEHWQHQLLGAGRFGKVIWLVVLALLAAVTQAAVWAVSLWKRGGL